VPSSTSQDVVLQGELAGSQIGSGLWILPGQGNALAARTDEGLILIDAGNRNVQPAMERYLRAQTQDRVSAIVYTHGHQQYNASIPLWLEHNASREEPPPRLIAHENILARYKRYRETAELQARAWKVQFPSREERPLADYLSDVEGDNHDPSETFSDQMVVVGGSRPVELHWAPSETDDCLAAWFPEDGLLYGGPAVQGDTIPNIGTPLRTQRFTIRWAETLEHLAQLGADKLVTEFGPLIEGAEPIRERLTGMAEALRWLRTEVVARMNRGMNEEETVADLHYPEAIFQKPWMTPSYGSPDYIARDLYREENGWWDRNPTHLHPATPTAARDAILSAIDPSAVLARARELQAAGDTQLALHVIDLVALASGNQGAVGEAKALKARLCSQRAREVAPYVSKALFWSSASLLKEGHDSWQDLP
jgi:alkyl sulfatase BDS1-like metallo-beta-lactamase superfamily hydrolase